MKHQLFISYSNIDKDKVSLIVNELRNHDLFTALVIASNREALKPLVKKVSDGIESSSVIIPILSSKSIVTQWINQEIGYSMALRKTIRPIVEQVIIGDLKGFIHKQVDLPYSFEANENKEVENTNFIKTFRDLISDLELEFAESKPKLPQESSFEQTLKLVDKHNSKKQFEQKRENFLSSQEAIEKSREEVLKMFELIKKRIEILKGKNINFGTEEDPMKPLFIFRSNGYSCSFRWSLAYSNTINDAKLLVKYWKGDFTTDQSTRFYPDEQPKAEKFFKLSFDVDEDFNLVWKENGIEKSTEKLVDDAFNWMITKF